MLNILLGLVLFESVPFARADLPIHCIHDQVFGLWKLTFNKPTSEIQNCGYESPDRNSQHFNGQYTYKLVGVDEEELDVQPPTMTAKSSSMSNGFMGNIDWSMVYDEGIHFSTKGGRTAFAFFEYQPLGEKAIQSDDVNQYQSDCTKTRIGWYHQSKGDETLFGCFKAEMTQANSNDTSSVGKNTLQADDDMVVSPTSFVNVRKSLEDHSEPFTFNLTFIEEQNRNPASTWRAAPHEHLHGAITKGKAYKMLGVTKYQKPNHGWDRRTYHHRQAAIRKKPSIMSFIESDAVKNLPKSYDWREHLEDVDVIDQGSCGSCYSVSSTMMAEVRRKIALSKTESLPNFMSNHANMTSTTKVTFSAGDRLSPQDVLNCSPENQGCEGGYPFLVGWHAYRRGHAIAQDVSYKGEDLKDACAADTPNGRLKAKGYGYIGGHYGAATNEALMMDIFKNGPATVGIDVPSTLFSYRSGIFQCGQTKHEGTNLADLHPWESTSHAVVAYGWGTDEAGKEYWILKNSWGKYWGEDGFFKLQRDNSDACAILSMPVGVYY